VQRSVAHAVILRAIARRLSPTYLPLFDQAIAKWGLSEDEIAHLILLSESDPWGTMQVPAIENRIAEDLGQNPFNDVGSPRSATWAAFGISWTVKGAADQESWIAALELAATLQIAQVDFADTDLLIIPSEVFLNVRVGNVDQPAISQLPDNGRLVWDVIMPKSYGDGTTFDEASMRVASIAIAILGQATALSFEAFQVLVEERFRRGLAHRLSSVRPGRELMKFAQPEALDASALAAMPRLPLNSNIRPIEAEELRWRNGPGPGYSQALAEEYLRNRYRRTLGGLRHTLPNLLENNRAKRFIAKLRNKGLLDWQILNILFSAVIQYQTGQKTGLDAAHPIFQRAMQERLGRDENANDPEFDPACLSEEDIEMQIGVSSAAAFKTWDLGINRQTPDFTAMKRLLDERYGHSTDDIPHDDPFPGV
jgi:hypothetical protein